MWNYLVCLSTWAEGNSGQIQIVIAIGAIILAFGGYRRVLDQIDFSHKQEKMASDQRGYELKIQSLSLLLTALDRVHSIQKNLHAIVEHLEQSIPPHTNDEHVNIDDVKETIKSSKKKIEESKELQ